MERLLNAVLEGHWSIDEAIRWFSSTGFPLPQDALIQVPQALESSPRIIRAKFAAQILDRVRDEVGCILAAEETRHASKPALNEAQRAVISQSQTSSPVATPATCGGGASAHHVAKSKQAPQQLFPSSSASDVAVRRPGALTDADFPSLGGDASRSSRSAHRKEPTSRGGSNNAVRGSGSLPRPAGTKTMSTVHNNAGDTANIGTNTNTKPHLTPPPLQMPRVVATRQGAATNNYTITHTSPASCDSSAGSTPMASRRRIQPTAVASVEVSKTFVGAAPQRSPAPAAPSTARIAAPERRAQDKQSAERLAVLELRRQSSNKTTTTFTANNNDNNDDDDDCNDAGQQWPDVHAVGGGKPRAPPATTQTPWSSGLIKVRTEYNNRSSETFDVGKNIVGDCGRVHSPEQRRVQAVGADVEPCGRDSAIPSAAEPPAVPTDDADVVGSTARLLEHTPLSDPGCRLAALHAMVVSHHSDVYLADQIDLLMNLLAVPLAVRRRVSQRKGESVGRLLTCGLHAQQYAALVLNQAGCLLRALGARLLEGIAATAADTLEELSSFSMPTYMPPPRDDRHLHQTRADNDDSRITAMEDSHGAHASGQNNIQESRRPFQVLRDAAAEAERALASRQLRTEKAFNAIKSTDGFEAGLQGLGAFTSDGHRHRHPEEQRRLRNRETARNEWYELMRDASALATSFGTNVSHPPSSLSTRSSGGGEDSHHDAVVLGKLQVRAAELVRSLRPDNMGPFAELFTAAVLQAAATGEAFMDSELTSLAKKVSSSKFASLTKRFVQQGEGPGAPRARAGPTRFQRAHSKQQQQQQQQRCVGARASGHGEGAGTMGGVAAQPPGRGSSELSGADAHASSIGNQHRHASSPSSSAALALHQQPQYHKAGRPAKGGPLACDEVTMAAASIAAEFPPVLRLYVLFLEAADSHRLNVNITRVMTHRLLALTASGTTSNGSKGVGGGGGGNAYKEGAAGPGMGEKAVIMATLASFLGYLTFTKFAGASVSPPPPATHPLAIGGGDVIASSSAPIDVVAALQAAYNNATALVRTLPWVVRYLKFLPWDQEALVAPYYQRALGCVSKLRDRAELSPKSSAFGPAALCLRALLDDLVESVPILFPQQSDETHQHQHTTQSHNLDKGGARKHLVSNDVAYNNGDDDASNALSRKETAATAHAPVFSSTRAAALAAADAWVDSRYMEVCCPLLVQATRLFVFAGGGGGGGDFRGSGGGQRGPGTPRTAARIEARVVKKIRPTAPRSAFKSTSSSAASSSSSAAVVDFSSSKGEDAGGYDDSAPADGLTTANSKFSRDENSRRHGGSEERLRKVPLRAPCIAPAPRDDISVRLQATFLRQYSGEERRVKLQDVVEFCSDVIGSNAATSAMMATALPAVESACAALADHVLSQAQNLVASRATDSVERDGNDGDESGNKAMLALLEPTLRRYAVQKGENMAASTAQKVIDDAFKLAQQTIREHAVRAVVALAPPDLTQPVLETAAAMVAETAKAGCAPLLVDLAQKQVHDAVMRGAERAVASALKALK